MMSGIRSIQGTFSGEINSIVSETVYTFFKENSIV